MANGNAAVNISLNLTGVPPTITELHIHAEYAVGLQDTMEAIMANLADVMARIADLQAGQTETLKDVRRLITEQDTSAAVTKLDELIGDNTKLDAEVEAASPEPTTP